MPDYTLYCFPESGNCYKVALMLALSEVDWQAKFVDFFAGETREPEYRKLNSMGEAPMLDHNGYLLTQSGVILDYLVEQLGRFGPADDIERRQILRWILFDNHKLTSYIGTLRFIRRFTDQGENEVTAFLEGRAKAALKVLDNHLEQQPFAIGDKPTIADVSMCGYLYFDDELGFSLDPYQNVQRWLGRIKSLPGWQHPYDLIPGKPSA